MESQEAWTFGQEWEFNVQQQLRMVRTAGRSLMVGFRCVENNTKYQVIAGVAVDLDAYGRSSTLGGQPP